MHIKSRRAGIKIAVSSCASLTIVAFTFLIALNGNAIANGYHFPELGTVAQGRGGAFVALADDPTALFYNPAGAARLSGTHILLSGNLLIQSVGFQRRRYDATGNLTENYLHDPSIKMPLVESTDTPFVVPFFGVVSDLHFLRRINAVVMAGIYSPNGHRYHTFPRFCKPGVEPCEAADTGLPNPARYDIVDRDVIVLYPTIGAAWQPFRSLRVGGVAQLSYAQFAYHSVIAAFEGEKPTNDLDVYLTSKSGITPTGIVGTQWAPLSFLELGMSVRFGFTFHTTGEICTGQKFGDRCDGVTPAIQSRLPIAINAKPNPAPAGLDVPVEWTIRSGARYIYKDALQREKFDVEFDFIWETTGDIQSFDLNPLQPITVDTVKNPVTIATVNTIPVPHRWNDSYSLRLGGSYHFYDWLKHGVITLRGGGFYESPAVPDAYTRLDFIGLQRFGLSLGAGLKWGRYRIDTSYAGTVFLSRDVHPPTGQAECKNASTDQNCGSNVRQIVPIRPSPDKYGVVVGNGQYTASAHQLTFSATIMFDM